MPKVLVTRRIPDAGLRLLSGFEVEVLGDAPPSVDLLRARVRGVDAILSLLTERVDEALLDAAGPQLNVVANMAVGFDNVDVAAATRRGIPVGNTPGVLTDATADLTMALLLSAARRLAEGQAQVRDGRWTTWEPMGLLGRDLRGATLGIFGFGRIGQAVAKRAAGFGMELLFTSRSPVPSESARQVDFDELLARSDFVTVHAPLNAHTRRLFSDEVFAKMKRTAVFVNTSRGGLVDQEALYRALTADGLFAAALDVTAPEPLPSTHPLLTLPNCLIVPHVGSATVETRDAMATLAARNVLAALRRERLPHCVNPEVYEDR